MATAAELLAADYKAMLNGVLAKDFTISNGSQSVAVRGLFDEHYETVDPETHVAVMSSNPRLTLFKSDVPFAIKQGITVSDGTRTWRVHEPMPDGEGAVILILKK